MDNLAIWLATGLAAGWVARSVVAGPRDFGPVGDLITGCLGAVIGGWVTRKAGVVAPNNLGGHAFIALTGAVTLLGGMRGLHGLLPAIVTKPFTASSSLGSLFEGDNRRSSDFMRGLIARFLERTASSTDPNQTFDNQMTFGERIADKVASFGGSWTFIGLFLIAMISWMAINEDLAKPLDPFPFILLNLILSCLAAIQAPVIMMSQNRQAARDRLDARNDYEVNLRAEVEIMALHAKIDAARNEEMAAQAERMHALAAQLNRIEAHLNSSTSGGRPPA